MNNLLPLLQRLNIYKLKRAFGSPIDIYRLVSSQTDVLTGARVVVTEMKHVRRAIVLPCTMTRNRLMRKMAAGTEASRDFTAAGAYDTDTRDIIIDIRDAPCVKMLTPDDWIVFRGRKYQVKKGMDFQDTENWIVTVSELIGEVPQQTFEVRLYDQVVLSDGSF